MSKKKATSSDVAKRAGVSQATVSMVLNKKYNVSFSRETVEKVEQAARELGYHLPGRKNRKESRKAEKKLADAKEENTTRYNVVMDSVNLEEVRDRAINDLGMGYATSDQIIEYQNPVNDYVKQYESIPKSGVLGQTTDK